MKWSFASVALIVLGLTGVAVIMLFQQITTNNENDYYLLKEVTEAAMIDAIDISYYRDTGDLKIDTEKFVENFTRRFAESTVFVSSNYNIHFYNIMETPPKVSVYINTGVGEYTIHGNSDEYNISNKLDAILEYTGKYTYVSENNSYYNEPYISHCTVGINCVGKPYEETYYAILSSGSSKRLSIKTPDDLNLPNIKNVKIESIKYDDTVSDRGEINQALLRYELTYNNEISDYYNIPSYNGTVSNISFGYNNCSEGKGDYNCDEINKYYVDINGNVSGNVILKYTITWSYEEYEFGFED